MGPFRTDPDHSQLALGLQASGNTGAYLRSYMVG